MTTLPKVALITGITGQDGSYLAEFLLEKGYIVHGLKRRSSLFNTARIDHLYRDRHEDDVRFFLHHGDLTDSSNLIRIIQQTQPDEIYNLAAQSHVAVSFEVPEYTANSDALGTLRILEAIRILGLENKTKFYQASTSELYGLVQETPQKETTPFYPRSPYAVAKMYAYWITVNYREAYNMFACNGILFNHETVAGFMPVIFKEDNNGYLQIKPLSQLVKNHLSLNKTIDETNPNYQEFSPDKTVFIWDKNGWTKIKFASAYPHDTNKNNKKARFLIAKNAAYLTTDTHKIIMDNGDEKEQQHIELGDKVSLINYPKTEKQHSQLSEKEYELLGFIIGDGSCCLGRTRITGKDKAELQYFADIWMSIGGKINFRKYETELSQDGVWQCDLTGNREWIKQFEIYDENHKKMIPWQVLNTSQENKLAFLKGYYQADGLKSVPLSYEFKGFCTNSATLASGLLFLLSELTGQRFNINIEFNNKWGEFTFYYKVNLLSNSDCGQNRVNSHNKYELVGSLIANQIPLRKIARETGISRKFVQKVKSGYIPDTKHHFELDNNQIKKIIEYDEYSGWFYDVETESGTFHCGIGQGHVHNSPVRGETFVTRKITRALARIKLGLQDCLYLGNMDALRDWGHAKDYVEAQWLMLQQDQPEDFVIASGEQYSVRQFVNFAAAELDMAIRWEGQGVDEKGYDATGKCIVQVEPRYFRPTEVETLLGDPSKAKNKLGWSPKISFQELVQEMVREDLKSAERDELVKTHGFGVYDYNE